MPVITGMWLAQKNWAKTSGYAAWLGPDPATDAMYRLIDTSRTSAIVKTPLETIVKVQYAAALEDYVTSHPP
jgi:hypothetical protein